MADIIIANGTVLTLDGQRRMIKDGAVVSNSFRVVPTHLKIFGPTLRDHRPQ